MIDRVSFDGTTFNRLPFKFEAGTPNIAGVIGLGAAVRWVQVWTEGQLRSMSSSCCGAVTSWLGRCMVFGASVLSGTGSVCSASCWRARIRKILVPCRSAGHRHQDGASLRSTLDVPI